MPSGINLVTQWGGVWGPVWTNPGLYLLSFITAARSFSIVVLVVASGSHRVLSGL